MILDIIRKIVPVITFVAGAITIAIGAHKIVDTYADPGQDYSILQAKVSIGASGGLIRITVIKYRPECSRINADILLHMKDGSEKTAVVEIGGRLTPGKHTVVGEFKIKNYEDVDTTRPATFTTLHECGEKPRVTAICEATFIGMPDIVCNEEE
jgi:hypothetical protein